MSLMEQYYALGYRGAITKVIKLIAKKLDIFTLYMLYNGYVEKLEDLNIASFDGHPQQRGIYYKGEVIYKLESYLNKTKTKDSNIVYSFTIGEEIDYRFEKEFKKFLEKNGGLKKDYYGEKKLWGIQTK